MKKNFLPISLIAVMLIPAVSQADDSPVAVSFGVALQPSTWKGENKNGSDYEQNATQLQLSIRVRKGGFYTGLSFQGAEYDFEDGAPDKVGPSNALSQDDAKIKRGESDLVFGYFFWSQVSLFVDFKRIHNNWSNDPYSQSYHGMGIGVSGFNPINDKWILFGSLGFINLDVRTDDKSIGDGKGSALVIGTLYKLTDHANLSFSLKSQHNELDFDYGGEQDNDVGGLVLGFDYSL